MVAKVKERWPTAKAIQKNLVPILLAVLALCKTFKATSPISFIEGLALGGRRVGGVCCGDGAGFCDTHQMPVRTRKGSRKARKTTCNSSAWKILRAISFV